MRKFSMFWSLLAVSMLTVGVSSAYAVDGTFEASVSPNRASTSKKDLKPMAKLNLKGTIGNGPDGSPPITQELRIQFNDKAIIDKRALKGTAKFSQVENTGNCSSKHRLGSGKAVATVLPLIPTLNAKVNICLVERSPGAILTAAIASKVDALGIVIALKADVKAIGGKPVIIMDANLPAVVGITPRIQSLDVKLNRLKRQRRTVKGKKRYLLNNPLKCPTKGEKKGLWSALQTLTFKDGTPPLVVSSEFKCKKAKKAKKAKRK